LQWMLIDELFEQERHIRAAMANRSGVLGLLLHQTIDHDPLHPLKSSSWTTMTLFVTVEVPTIAKWMLLVCVELIV